MAEQLQFRPAEAKRRRAEAEAELERLEGRLAEINGLLDELYASGIIRWLKDFAGAMPQISAIALANIDTPEGKTGLRNLLIAAQTLGKIDPDRLQRLLDALDAGVKTAAKPPEESAYNPPGVTGAFKLLHDKELWTTLAPVLAGVKAFAAAQKRSAEEDDPR